MRYSNVFFLTAVMSMAVFAQYDIDDMTETRSTSPSFGGSSYTAPVQTSNSSTFAQTSNSSAFTQSSNSSERNKGPKLRFSGDITLNTGFELDNDYVVYQEELDGGRTVDVTINDKSKAFNVQYGWNANLGVDFNDNFSVDFRFSNPDGYGLGNLAFENGSAKRYLPTLPHAYFTARTNGAFRFQGGLLEVPGNTILDLVAGAESFVTEYNYSGEFGNGLWTSYWGWDCEYNASQGGVRFGFDFSDNFALNLTAALVSPSNTLDAYETHNEFRFILDANIGLGDVGTLTPVVATRSYWKSGYYYEEINGVEKYEDKTPILLAYGAELGLDFSDAFSLDVGFALGHMRFGKEKAEDNGFGYFLKADAKEKMSGFLAKVAPSFSFGVNEIALQYSLGIGNYIESGKAEVRYEGISGKANYKERDYQVFNDLAFNWDFRVNENIAFGPNVQMAFRTDNYSEKYETTIPEDRPYDEKEKHGGYKYTRFGINFTASF